MNGHIEKHKEESPTIKQDSSGTNIKKNIKNDKKNATKSNSKNDSNKNLEKKNRYIVNISNTCCKLRNVLFCCRIICITQGIFFHIKTVVGFTMYLNFYAVYKVSLFVVFHRKNS